MNLRNYLLLIFACAGAIICSCEKNKPNPIATTIRTEEPSRVSDSVLASIQEKTKIVTIDLVKENKVTSKKGINFFIPENAFVTKDGMKPTGKVQVTISEYHNPADILVSKIPMLYNTKDGAVQMESAGMFSITARAKNEELHLASGKEISVQVPSKNSDPNFNLYYFDPTKNAWVQTIDSLPAEQNESIEVKQSAEQPAEKIEYAGINVEWSAVEANKRVVDGKVITLVKPDCSYKNANFNFPILIDKFPELSLYKDAVWIGSSNYDETILNAAFDNDQFVSATIRGRETPLNRYLISFEFRHTKFNAYMKIASKAEACELNEEIYFSYYDNRPVDEKKIEKIAIKAKKSKSQSTIFRSFAINKLGLWNCDRLYVLPEKMIVTPQFRSITSGAYYEAATMYLIDKKINSVWTCTEYITLNPNSDNIVLFINEKGRLCHARLNKLSKTHKEQALKLIIDVEELADNPDNTEELNVLINRI